MIAYTQYCNNKYYAISPLCVSKYEKENTFVSYAFQRQYILLETTKLAISQMFILKSKA